jgi:hypothetical protein
VNVGHHLLSNYSFTGLCCKTLREGKEELLVTRESILDGRIARDGHATGVVGGSETREVGDVFVTSLLAVHRQIGKWFVGVVLRDEDGGGGFKMREVGGFPPISNAPMSSTSKKAE